MIMWMAPSFSTCYRNDAASDYKACSHAVSPSSRYRWTNASVDNVVTCWTWKSCMRPCPHDAFERLPGGVGIVPSLLLRDARDQEARKEFLEIDQPLIFRWAPPSLNRVPF